MRYQFIKKNYILMTNYVMCYVHVDLLNIYCLRDRLKHNCTRF